MGIFSKFGHWVSGAVHTIEHAATSVAHFVSHTTKKVFHAQAETPPVKFIHHTSEKVYNAVKSAGSHVVKFVKAGAEKVGAVIKDAGALASKFAHNVVNAQSEFVSLIKYLPYVAVAGVGIYGLATVSDLPNPKRPRF